MRRRTYERRRALCARVAAGIHFEQRARRRSFAETVERIAQALGIPDMAVLALLNPTRPKPPKPSVRRALETFSARWPGGPVRSRDWWK